MDPQIPILLSRMYKHYYGSLVKDALHHLKLTKSIDDTTGDNLSKFFIDLNREDISKVMEGILQNEAVKSDERKLTRNIPIPSALTSLADVERLNRAKRPPEHSYWRSQLISLLESEGIELDPSSEKIKFPDEILNSVSGDNMGTRILPILKKMYKNIDIRAILVKSKDNKWNSAFLKIFFTKESKTNVQYIHKSKESFRTILKDPNLMVVSEYKDIAETQAMFDEIKEGRITINENTVTLLTEGVKNIFSYDLSSNEHVIDLYTTSQQRDKYPHKLTCLGIDRTPREIIKKNGISLMEHGRDIFEFLHPYLDSTSVNSTNNNLVIIFPVYCKSVPLSEDEKERYYKKLSIHDYFVEGSDALLEFRKEGELKSIDNPKLSNYAYKLQSTNGICSILLPKPDPASEIDKITISITDEVLGLILTDEISLNKLGTIQATASEDIEKLLEMPIDRLCKEDESRYLEFKSSLRWDYDNSQISEDVELSAIKELAAFMNTAGGLLVIGRDDKKQILGLQKDFDTFKDRKNWDGWQQHLGNLLYGRYKIHKKCNDYISIYKEQHNDVIAKIKVQRSPEPIWIEVKNQEILYIRTDYGTASSKGKEAGEYIMSHWGSK